MKLISTQFTHNNDAENVIRDVCREFAANNIQEDIDDLNCDIEIKSKLIEQLELSQQRMNQMRQQYEDKLMLLTSKVVNTQKERDDILSMIGKTTSEA